MRYEKIPHEVDAVQFDGTNYEAVKALVGEAKFISAEIPVAGRRLAVITFPFGSRTAVDKGAYVLKSVKGGNVTVVKEADFEKEYRPVKK